MDFEGDLDLNSDLYSCYVCDFKKVNLDLLSFSFLICEMGTIIENRIVGGK